MKNKKMIFIVILIFIILLLLILLIYQFWSIQKTYNIIYKYETRNEKPVIVNRIINKSFLLCNWNIFKPQIAYILEEKYKNKKELSIGFYNFQKEYLIFGKWNFEYTGGTTISNTTFPQLLKMVKEDCYQFQKSSSTGLKETDTEWVYSQAESKEVIEKRKQDRIKKEKQEREAEREAFEKLSEEEKEKYLKQIEYESSIDINDEEALIKLYNERMGIEKNN